MAVLITLYLLMCLAFWKVSYMKGLQLSISYFMGGAGRPKFQTQVNFHILNLKTLHIADVCEIVIVKSGALMPLSKGCHPGLHSVAI